MDLLPVEFTDKMRELLGDEFDSFLAVYEDKHNAGIRVNTLKLTPEDFEKLAPAKIDRVPWINNGYYYNEDDQLSKHPYYYGGLYYIQEPSAMTPASLLPVVPGDKVLDICAAPGGKSTELGAKLKGRGVLVSNDISNSRAKALLKNVELFGIRNPIVISEAPVKLTDYFTEYFDKILVDAPCSGEGMFRKSHAIIKNWAQYGTGYYAKLQREILPQAIAMLKKGGYLLYSTCTFSTEEDEGTLQFILDNYPEMEVVPVIEADDPKYQGFCFARPELIGGDEQIRNGLRLYPHKLKGEGHFVALLHKKDEAGTYIPASGETAYIDGYQNSYDESTRKKYKAISDETFDFFERVRFEIPAERLFVKEDRVYLIPEDIPNLKGLRVMRSGLLLGEMKKGRFEPSQALACALRACDYDNIYDISSSNPDVIKYLKCETIEIPDSVQDGFVLICCDGYPLGWGKASAGRLKNKYLPGWRMM